MTDLPTLLRGARFRFTGEADLQEGIARALAGAGVAFEREVSLSSRDRIDFLVGDVGLEVKIEGGAAPVLRQLLRYALSPRVGRLLLATTRSQHRQLPGEISGKPLDVIYLAGSML